PGAHLAHRHRPPVRPEQPALQELGLVMRTPYLLGRPADHPADPYPRVVEDLRFGRTASREGSEVRNHVVQLPHRGLHPLDHSHVHELLHRLETREGTYAREPGAGCRPLEGEADSDGRHRLFWLAVRIRKPVLDLDTAALRHRHETPPAVRRAAVRTLHVVL